MAVSDLHGPWSAIRRSPMVRMATPFILGVAFATGAHPAIWPTVSMLALVSLAVLVMLLLPTGSQARWQRGAVQAAWFVAFGAAWQTMRSPRHDALHASRAESEEGYWLVEVDAVNSTSLRAVRADAELIGRMTGLSLQPVHGRVLLTLLHGDSLQAVRPGDRLSLEGSAAPITRIPDPGGFDRRAWAASRGIAHEMLGGPGRWQVLTHRWRWTEAFTGLRARIGAWLEQSGLSASERALVKALVLGERDELDGDRRDAFVRSGTIHVLAVSGMHVGLIYMVLSFLSGWWGKGTHARWIRGLFVLLALWFYAGLTGSSPSVLRATVMFSLFTLAGAARQRTDHLNSLFAASLVLLLWDPGMLMQASFQLSFLAVLGIILFLRPIEQLWSPRPWLVRKAWSLAALSLSAQALTTPVSMYLFKAFPMWFLPANLIVVTVVGIAVYGGVALLVLHQVPLVGAAITGVLTVLLGIIDASTAFFAGLPGAYPAVRVEFIDMILLYVLVLAFGAWWRWRWGAARILTFVTIAVLLGHWSIRAHEAGERTTFVVYDQPGGLLASMLSGRELVVAASADSLLVHEGVISKLERHQRQAGIDRIIPAGTDFHGEALVQHGSTMMAQGRWRSAALDILLFDGATDPPQDGRFDAIVLHAMKRVDDEQLLRLSVCTRRFVLASDLSWRARDRIMDWADRHDVAVHDIRTQGVFILRKTD
ncbi:MAG: ComEC/Rec2 family competence protein [Flavobacteriales bacterium]|nr:ComEC/Rec2 family competence protein [Flavobacteriales bacterium]